jgi:hypothetical protein
MAIEATYAKYKKNNFLIGIIILLVFGIYCMYDGYFNDKFQRKHTIDGKPDGTLKFNQKVPFVLLPGAAILVIWMQLVKNRKITAESEGININGKETITYDSIEKIDKTYFETKEYFDITYKNESGSESKRRLDGRDYDNLAAILNELVAKISEEPES